eukprot:CAMPEP_0202943058 /NCGR_PEP_ID=MMETSP1395-20130829/3347_1 /ASSEMBLY_ACC=CAM_ASM_000871 /TAXON_ID=5961 /ORGANISM="Blepharisma japonicum, Strain Stock R1072" /LENGTH=45 /DNA_ID= /DNA_START= /DNA_END= /DNA_ORIENTATION=
MIILEFGIKESKYDSQELRGEVQFDLEKIFFCGGVALYTGDETIC